MTVLSVGSGQQYSTLAKAVAAASDGDTIQVRAGTYTNDFTTIAKDVTIEGVGGTAKFVATVAPPNGKAIMVTRADVTLRNLEFTGAKVADDNGAGVRYESGDLTVENSYFHHNQMGLLSNGDSDGTITVRNSEFAFNGGGDGYTHSLYVNRIQKLTVEDSYFHDANNGHHIKSRAANTILTGNRVLDGPNGMSSYNIDLPNGGKAVLTDNLIQQNAKSPNVAIISYGAEGNLISGSSLKLIDNVVVNDLASTNVKLLANRTTVAAEISGTDVWGLTASQMASGAAKVAGTSYLGGRPALDTGSTWNDGPGTDAPAPNPTPDPTPTPAPSTGLTGTSGDDLLVGTNGADVIRGLAGDDSLDGAAGADQLAGGTGDDRYVIDTSGDVIAELLGQGVDTVTSSVAYTLDEHIEVLVLEGTGALGGTGNSIGNTLHGNTGSNLLRGLDGNDKLYGKPGDDRLEGGDGADLLRGGLGQDDLVGGADSDRFDWDSTAEAGVGSGRDVVLDFVRGSDKLDLAGIDAIAGTSTNDAFDLIGSAAFTGEAGELRVQRFDTTGTDYLLVQADVNGDRIADLEIMLQGQLAPLQAADFVV